MALHEKYNVVNVFVSAVTPENVSRQQLLAWVNDTLQSNLTKIEEMSNGAAYCLMTDRLFPGSVPLRKVKWNPRSDMDSIANWKVLQNAWHELGINKPVQVQVLMKGKFQDNFEFLQWFRRFYDNNNAGYEYDPVAARNNEPFPISAASRTSKLPAANRVANPAAGSPFGRPAADQSGRSRRAPSRRDDAPNVGRRRRSSYVLLRSSSTHSLVLLSAQTTTVARSKAELSAEAEAKYKKEISELKDQVATWENSIGAIEKERDYYYQRLHRVELLCNERGSGQQISVDEILGILYQEEDGSELQEFEAVEEEVLSDKGGLQQSNATIDRLSNPGDIEAAPAEATLNNALVDTLHLDEDSKHAAEEPAEKNGNGLNPDDQPGRGDAARRDETPTKAAESTHPVEGDEVDLLESLGTPKAAAHAKPAPDEQESF
ncbi:hypothetical protein M3Y99_01379200 [Aphelenchoides fujianensis]|nr:hypothetical protein M3Y99_01379200 [Aphelenchoides fujianensis]